MATVGASMSALGTWYLSGAHIYADTPNSLPVNFDEEQPLDPLTAYARDVSGGEGYIQGKTGIARFDYMSMPNNSPRWSANAMASVSVFSNTSWTMFALFEGYNGWDCVEAVGSRLIKDVMESLTQLLSQYVPLSADHAEIGTGAFSADKFNPEDSFSDAVDGSIKKVFVDLDYGIVNQALNVALASEQPSKTAVSRALGTAMTGSSALLSFYDQESRELKIALTGDSRAVLGRRPKGKDKTAPYEVHVLTADQTWRNPEEQARIRALHPDESFPPPDSEDRIPVTRAFGLGAYKWGLGLQERLHREFLGSGPPPAEVKSPPYLTAEPEITTTNIETGDFLILGSQGLFKSLTNEEVVGLVGLWLDKGMHQLSIGPGAEADASPVPNRVDTSSTRKELSTFEARDLPVVPGKDETVMYSRWRAQKRFVCMDVNAAAHLTRNALGGADEDLLMALTAIQPPRACRFRDDLNVTVIFFDNDT